MKKICGACVILFASMPVFAGEVGTGGPDSVDTSAPVETVETSSHWQGFLDALSGSFNEADE
ncbi:MAG: hypothetical protein KY410_06190 [Proteobacteria bacterium]|nr:hypothetical protein [Pseudomonadota bacterium]